MNNKPCCVLIATGQNRGEMLGEGGGGGGGKYCYVRAILVGGPVNVRGFKWYSLK